MVNYSVATASAPQKGEVKLFDGKGKSRSRGKSSSLDAIKHENVTNINQASSSKGKGRSESSPVKSASQTEQENFISTIKTVAPDSAVSSDTCISFSRDSSSKENQNKEDQSKKVENNDINMTIPGTSTTGKKGKKRSDEHGCTYVSTGCPVL